MIELQKEAIEQEGMVEYGEHVIRQETKQILDSIQPNSFEDFAYGSMIGAFIADSMGSLEEFAQDPVPEERLAQSLAMPGGGPHRVGPG